MIILYIMYEYCFYVYSNKISFGYKNSSNKMLDFSNKIEI